MVMVVVSVVVMAVAGVSTRGDYVRTLTKES